MADAARAHLARIIEGEHLASVRRLGKVRVGAATLGLMLTVGLGVLGGRPAFRGALPVALAYFGVACALLAWPYLFPRFSRRLGLSLAVVDIPLLTFMLFNGLDRSSPFVFDGIGWYAAVVTGSALTLSRGVVAGTCAAAVVGGVATYATIDAPIAEQSMVVLPPVFTAALCIFLASRIRALVEEARRDDLLGKYILGERLGVGGMAEVFRATYSPEGGFERQVAVKRVLPAYASDLNFIERFRREARLTAQLVHPNIVQVLDFGYHRDTYFLAMELVDGVPLSRVLKRSKLPLSAATYIALELSKALDFIHNRIGADGSRLGLVHRDVNPPNVLLSRHGEVKLADFGVARATEGSHLTASGVIVGKLSYLAPEQVRGEVYDGKADMFGLGLSFYEMVAGQRAYSSTNDVQILKELMDPSFAPPSQHRSDVPAALDTVVLGLLQRDPQKRPTAAALRSQLSALAGPAADALDGRRQVAAAVMAALGDAHDELATGPKPTAEQGEATRTSLRDA